MLRRDNIPTEGEGLVSRATLRALLNLCYQAGDGIMAAQRDGLRISKKSDASMVTHADEEADALIVSDLQRIAPGIPVISEEGNSVAEETLKNGRFWLVDPLDGTSGYIRGGQEYTVNIALIENQQPLLGVIVIPATGEGFCGIVGMGAWKQTAESGEQAIHVRAAPEDGWHVLLSHRGAHDKARQLLRKYPISELKSASSSLKFCRIAEGMADVYPRLGPTMEWDTAAGHAILKAAGGEVYALPSGEPFCYGRRTFLNGSFLAVGGVTIDVARLQRMGGADGRGSE
ncbi:MAG: 3'(2'),5'-bisphosphate nucleotidase CysQ [Rickettsiales bacterium]|nr:3'(2'),5'-bisphosphate nucleotidase CysQ [Rickettsiales bacterium]